MTRVIPMLALAFAVTYAAPADAKKMPRPKSGDSSLSFAVPSGGNSTVAGAAGLWYMVSDDANLGMNVGLGLNFADNASAYDILLAPQLRYYLSKKGRVSPFVLGQVNVRLFENGAGDFDGQFGLAGGLGGEIWLLEELSLAGHIGLGIDIAQGANTDPALGTFTSGLSANIYL